LRGGASTERVLVHEKDHNTFVSLLKEKVQKLRALEDGGGDLGFITFDNQKKIYEEQLSELNTSNSNIVVGGKFNDSKTRLYPTIVTNPNATGASNPIENTKIYNEETFGPVLAITKYTNIREAIEKANHNRYGLLASVIGQDLHLAEQVARQIEAGSVLINDVLYTHALAETPWGGIKDSGFGKVHSDSGLLEFCNTRHINKPLPFFGKIRAMWWFPYSPHQLSMFLAFSEFLYRRSFLRKLRAVPSILVEFVQMIKKEKRY
jgi:succinate-semialdehyde dehydrogenase/glutarate-semialdehyde dehydrogenase